MRSSFLFGCLLTLRVGQIFKYTLSQHHVFRYIFFPNALSEHNIPFHNTANWGRHLQVHCEIHHATTQTGPSIEFPNSGLFTRARSNKTIITVKNNALLLDYPLKENNRRSLIDRDNKYAFGWKRRGWGRALIYRLKKQVHPSLHNLQTFKILFNTNE